MKAFKVFWKGNIYEGEKDKEYTGSAIVVAETLQSCLDIATTYGEVSSIHSESELVITEPKPFPVPTRMPVDVVPGRPEGEDDGA